MKILVTGSNGQLGQEIRQFSVRYPFHEFIFTDIQDMDLLDRGSVERSFLDWNPDAVINCAGFTAVDKAESGQAAAYELNGSAAGFLAMNASRSGAIFIHISTDYVFSGSRTIPYTEEDIPDPRSVYAKSKYLGELEVMKNAAKRIIMQTSWLYSEFMNNFVKTIINRGRERGHLDVVYDQVGSPTYARDLAGAILDILPLVQKTEGVEIFHYSNEGVASWYDLAKSVIEFSGINCTISPILTSQYPLPAERPSYSVMSKAKFRERFGLDIPYWRDSLRECVEKIMNDELRITNKSE